MNKNGSDFYLAVQALNSPTCKEVAKYLNVTEPHTNCFLKKLTEIGCLKREKVMGKFVYAAIPNRQYAARKITAKVFHKTKKGTAKRSQCRVLSVIEKKIQSAKKQINRLRYKIRMLNELKKYIK